MTMEGKKNAWLTRGQLIAVRALLAKEIDSQTIMRSPTAMFLRRVDVYFNDLVDAWNEVNEAIERMDEEEARASEKELAGAR